MMCCFLPLSWLFAPNSTKHKEMFVFSNSLHCIEVVFFPQTIVLLGILTAQLFRAEMILFSTEFHFIMILFFLWESGEGLWPWDGIGQGSSGAGFCSINGLHCCSCNSPWRGRGLLRRSLNLLASLAELLPGGMEILLIWEKLLSLTLI